MRRLPLRALLAILACVLTAAAAVAADTVVFTPVQAGPDAQPVTVERYAPDRLLVQFAAGKVPPSLQALPQRRGAAVAGKSADLLPGLDAALAGTSVRAIERPWRAPQRAAKASALGVDRWFLLRLDTVDDVARVAERVRGVAGVQAVSLDWRAFPAAVPADPLYPDHWGHDNTGQLPAYDWAAGGHTGPLVGTPGFDAHAEQAWDGVQGYGDPGVVIAILDSGVDIDHPDLRLVAGYDYGDNDANPDDDSAAPGHGTACAGVAAAINNSLGSVGIAAGCSIMPCKVADSSGSMYFTYIQDALYGAADAGADVISMSLGAALTSDPATDAALQYAYDAGVVIFAATGNENASVISYPAVHAAVIGVGAASPCDGRKRSSSSRLEVNPGVNTDPNGYTCDGERWWGSNYGSTTPDAAGAVDILAPTILPTTDIGGNGGYVSGDYEPFFNGTSCATPYAAGVAGLVLSASPGLTPAEVRDALVSTATDVVNVESGAGWDRYSGYGLIDAAAAVGGGGPVAPTAALAATPTSGAYPLAVQFSDQSSGAPTSWSWDFGDGATSTAQNPGHTYAAVGTYTVSLTVSNAVGSDTVTEVDLITVTEPLPATFVTAGGETSVAGTVSGSYLDLAANDGVVETLTEELDTSHPRKRTSYLEHRWTFDLPAGGDATLHLAAARPANGDGDDFRFEYTTDGATWLALTTIASATEQTFSQNLGALAGPVVVRVVDTDRSWDLVSLDAVLVDYLVFEVGDVQPVAPTADFAADPTSGAYPLTVQFSDQSGGQPTSWAWTFGDGATSTAQNPSHVYAAAGVYTVSLTVANDQGSDTLTRTDLITVTEPGGGGDTMHVGAMAVSRKNAGPNVSGLCDVTVVDAGDQPVASATVTVSYDGPLSGTLTGLTGENGVVSFETGKIRNPSGEFCFEVTGITHASLTYDPGANVVTRACESGTVFSAGSERALPETVVLTGNSPNPFNPATVIGFALPREMAVRLTVFDVRGRAVAVLADGVLGAGAHEVRWDARDQASGLYFYRLEAPGFQKTGKMTILK
jgi:PKD repeat protein